MLCPLRDRLEIGGVPMNPNWTLPETSAANYHWWPRGCASCTAAGHMLAPTGSELVPWGFSGGARRQTGREKSIV